MQEIVFVVTENCQFEYRDKFILTKGSPGQLGLSGLLCEDHNKFYVGNFFWSRSEKLSDEKIITKIQTFSTEKRTESDSRDESKKLAQF